jgi:hypothetical protein
MVEEEDQRPASHVKDAIIASGTLGNVARAGASVMKNLFDMQYNDSRKHHHDGGENRTRNDLIIRTRTRRWRLPD